MTLDDAAFHLKIGRARAMLIDLGVDHAELEGAAITYIQTVGPGTKAYLGYVKDDRGQLWQSDHDEGPWSG